MKNILFITLFGLIFSSSLYYEADPFYLFEYEMDQFNSENFKHNLSNRPTLCIGSI